MTSRPATGPARRAALLRARRVCRPTQDRLFQKRQVARLMNQVIAERIAMWGAPAARRKDGLQRFVAGWAALGITLSGATQLRTSGLPIGLSEVFLAGWICFVDLPAVAGPPVHDRSRVLRARWLLAAGVGPAGARSHDRHPGAQDQHRSGSRCGGLPLSDGADADARARPAGPRNWRLPLAPRAHVLSVQCWLGGPAVGNRARDARTGAGRLLVSDLVCGAGR